MSTIPPLNQCAECHELFSLKNCPIQENVILVTACFHTYHPACLAQWISGAEKTCPTCRARCYQHQAGKDFLGIWAAFIKALQIDPTTVREALQSAAHQNELCAPCQQDLVSPPSIFLKFNKGGQLLAHQTCASSQDYVSLTHDDISQVVQKCAKKHPALANILTPSPPSLYQRVRRDHPRFFKIAVIGILSACAFLINTLQFQGKNRMLFVIGFPVMLIVKFAEQAVTIALNLLDQTD